MITEIPKPKVVIHSRAILRDCAITKHIANWITTNKTGKHRITIGSNHVAALTDPLDQRLMRMVDLRITHKSVGGKDQWDCEMLRLSPDAFYDTV